MPRASAENRSAAAWRASGAHPAAPGYLSREAKKLWREIVEARPVDFFQPGSLQLLEQFCETMITQRRALLIMAGKPLPDTVSVRTVKDLSAILNSTALKLRISVQAEVDRKSGQLDEREPAGAALIGAKRLQLVG